MLVIGAWYKDKGRVSQGSTRGMKMLELPLSFCEGPFRLQFLTGLLILHVFHLYVTRGILVSDDQTCMHVEDRNRRLILFQTTKGQNYQVS